MSKWFDYIDIEVKDAFETKDKIKDSKLISEIGIVTITIVRIKFDKRKVTKEQLITLTKGNETV